ARPARAAVDRHPGHHRLPAADLRHPGVAELAVLHAVLQRARAFLQRRRAGALADQAGAAGGLRAGRPAGAVRADQAGRVPERPPGRKPRGALREGDAMSIPLEWVTPLMFSGLVVFMLIGYPVSFSLAAVGFFFGFL